MNTIYGGCTLFLLCEEKNVHKNCKMEESAMHRLIAKIVNDQAFIYINGMPFDALICVVEKRHSATTTAMSHMPAVNK